MKKSSTPVPAAIVGLDLGDRHSHACFLDPATGAETQHLRLRTTRRDLERVFASLPQLRITLEDPARFDKSRTVGAYLGLAPATRSSGERDPQMHISREGDPYLRQLLVQCAQYILGPFGQDSDLRRHGLALALRGGKAAKKRAVVAVARKLAVLLHRLWVTQAAYQPLNSVPGGCLRPGEKKEPGRATPASPSPVRVTATNNWAFEAVNEMAAPRPDGSQRAPSPTRGSTECEWKRGSGLAQQGTAVKTAG